MPHHWRGWDERERRREGLKVGGSGRSRTIRTAVKGPQCYGRKWRLQLCAADTTYTRGMSLGRGAEVRPEQPLDKA